MRMKIGGALLLAVVFGVSVFGVRQWDARRSALAAASASEQTAHWHPAAQAAARLMIARYGPPREVSSFRLHWDGPQPWKRIVVEDEPRSPLEEVVAYRVPAEKLDSLARFPHGLRIYADEEALGARSDRESLNLLSLNLADDIVNGRTTPERANCEFLRTTRLQEAGKSSPYMERLLFKTGFKSESSY